MVCPRMLTALDLYLPSNSSICTIAELELHVYQHGSEWGGIVTSHTVQACDFFSYRGDFEEIWNTITSESFVKIF